MFTRYIGLNACKQKWTTKVYVLTSGASTAVTVNVVERYGRWRSFHRAPFYPRCPRWDLNPHAFARQVFLRHPRLPFRHSGYATLTARPGPLTTGPHSRRSKSRGFTLRSRHLTTPPLGCAIGSVLLFLSRSPAAVFLDIVHANTAIAKSNRNSTGTILTFCYTG